MERIRMDFDPNDLVILRVCLLHIMRQYTRQTQSAPPLNSTVRASLNYFNERVEQMVSEIDEALGLE